MYRPILLRPFNTILRKHHHCQIKFKLLFVTVIFNLSYYNIPAWEELSDQTKSLIRKYGWAQMDIEWIAEQAAKSLGMKVREKLSQSQTAPAKDSPAAESIPYRDLVIPGRQHGNQHSRVIGDDPIHSPVDQL